MADYNPGHIIPLYGVILRDAMASGDDDLKKSMLTVSKFMMERASSDIDDWKAAHAELEKAVG